MWLLAKFKTVRAELQQKPIRAAPPVTPLPDPADKIAAYHERFAIVTEAGDVTETEAHATAQDEVSSDIETLASQQIAFWQQKLQLLPEPKDQWLAKLVPGCRAQLHADWVIDAAVFGWTDVELFGLHPTAPNVRVEAMGLVVSIACSPFSRPVEVSSLTSADAVLQTGTGARLRYSRFKATERVPIWKHHAFHESALAFGRTNDALARNQNLAGLQERHL